MKRARSSITSKPTIGMRKFEESVQSTFDDEDDGDVCAAVAGRSDRAKWVACDAIVLLSVFIASLGTRLFDGFAVE